MEYSLYRLKFTTGLHIGNDRGGASLDDSRMTIHSDTLFSALCCECAGTEGISRLYEYFSDGSLVISDTLPYKEDEYFLPRPVLYTGNYKHEGKPDVRKVLKSIEFIPLSSFDEYLKGLSGSETSYIPQKYEFGGLTSYTRVALKDPPQPYQVAYWRFAENCGLYIIVQFESQEALSFFEDILSGFGLSGIGGKQSAGLGKFIVEKLTLPEKLKELLEDNGAEYQMLLGTALPDDKELHSALSGGWYTTIRRGGFVRSESYASRPLKKRTMYMLSPGSCLKQRFNGGIFDLSDGGAHPVWRCGKTLFAGVRA